MAAKKALKIYSGDKDYALVNKVADNVPTHILKAITDKANTADSLFPVYGELTAPSDIHTVGEQSIINKDGTGFAAIGLPKNEYSHFSEQDEYTPYEQRKLFEEMLYQALESEGAESAIIAEIMGEDWVEEDPNYPGNNMADQLRNLMSDWKQEKRDAYLKKHFPHTTLADIDGLDLAAAERVEGFDTWRDTDAEFRARQLTPTRIIPFVQSANPDFNIAELKDMSNKDVLRYFRSKGMSPYSLRALSKRLKKGNALHDDYSVASALSVGNKDDALRHIVDEVYRHEDDYISDLRLKDKLITAGEGYKGTTGIKEQLLREAMVDGLSDEQALPLVEEVLDYIDGTESGKEGNKFGKAHDPKKETNRIAKHLAQMHSY